MTLHRSIHTIPYDAGGATHASNIKCLCRLHHLLKTFWRWRDRQLPDGTVIWTMPGGQTYVTTPGSIWLFPSLAIPTGVAPSRAAGPPSDGDRTAMMPQRRTTRAQNRSHAIAAERARNREDRQIRHAAILGNAPPTAADDDPPPF